MSYLKNEMLEYLYFTLVVRRLFVEIYLFVDDIFRSVFRFVENIADVFAQYTDRKQLYSA